MPTGAPKGTQRALDLGARLVTAVNDYVFVIRGFQETIEEFEHVQVRG
jgi:hypothetical protein